MSEKLLKWQDFQWLDTWTPKALACLTDYWDARNPDGSPSYSTTQIGECMGISKNAVVGKAYRLNEADSTVCPPRPSPIRRAAAPVLKAEPERFHPRGPSRKRTLPPVKAAAEVVPEEPADGVIDAGEVPAVGAARLVTAAVRAFPKVSGKTCCWPLGEPGTKKFRFCSDPVMDKWASYCPEHYKLAYVRPKDRRLTVV